MFSRFSPLFLFVLLIPSGSALARSYILQRDVHSPLLAPAEPSYFTNNVKGCTSGRGGSFSFNWAYNTTDTPNVATVCGKGWSIGAARTIKYEGNYYPSGNSKLSVNGWTRAPLVEYYILEGWNSFYPPSAFGAKLLGNTTCNGAPYDILQSTERDQPSIDGIQTFPVFWSARKYMFGGQIAPQKIDVACHFKAFADFGLKLGSHAYQIVAVDAYFSSGTANITVS